MGTGSAAGGRNMARRTKRLAAIACAVAALALMAGCTPKGAAVGDTQNNETYEHNHNENTGARLDVAVIGSPHGGADELVMRSLATKEFKASYTGVQQYSADPQRAADFARKAVRDAVSRHPKVIVISGLTFHDDESQWNTALANARNAGIPVVLLNPADVPGDTKLFAATFVVNDRMMDAQPMGEALRSVIFDHPHEREIVVSTRS